MYPYRTLNAYYRSVFGGKVAKISIDAGFSCPNRDGTLDSRGCTFCSTHGSGDFAESSKLSIATQLESGKAQTSAKWQDIVGYIAYFQAFTNTYAPPERLQRYYAEALSQPQILGLSIATRPDCLPENVLDVLSDTAKKTKLWVELGLQTANEETASAIRRGYGNQTFVDAVMALHKRNIPVVAHVIIGLPNETEHDVLQTIAFLNRLPIQGIKLHLLHVLKHTALAEDYLAQRYTPLTKDEYLRILSLCIMHLREDIVIHRLTGDGDKETLLAPLWSLHKRDVLNSFHQLLKQNKITQGQALR